MTLEGFVEYKRREFCNDVKCPVQMELNRLAEKSEAYEQIRKTCSTACRYTTWQFHHWLIEKGYLIVKPIKRKVNVVSNSKNAKP
jgi:phage FluMu protein Com